MDVERMMEYNIYMSKLTSQERLDLKKLLRDSDTQDNTEHIRNVKHSVKIRDDIRALDKLKRSSIGAVEETAAKGVAPFLFENYPDIFKKVLKDELDLEIMSRLLAVLKLIEDGKVDQHEASVQVGKILKELYVDSALKVCKKKDEEQADKEEGPIYVQEKPISWGQWRNKRAEILANLEAAGVNPKV
jgi:hypothetical protein